MDMSEYKFDATESINRALLDMCPDFLKQDFERMIGLANKYGLTLPSLMSLLREARELNDAFKREDKEKKDVLEEEESEE